MNNSLKAKNLPLFSIIDLDQLRRENHLEGTEVTDFFTARDGKVYLLMEQPSETQGKDWLSWSRSMMENNGRFFAFKDLFIGTPPGYFNAPS